MAKKSTIVPNFTRRTLRLGLAGLERVSPDRAAALAERLWFYAGKPPAAAVRSRHAVTRGTAFSLRLGDAWIRGYHWGDSGAPLAYLVHGWGGWWQQLAAFVPLLLERGYHVIAFDALAHGDSGPGEFGRYSTSLPEMARAYEGVAERFGTPAATVAHSMGCLSVVWAQCHHGIVPDRQILIAPPPVRRGCSPGSAGRWAWALPLSTGSRIGSTHASDDR